MANLESTWLASFAPFFILVKKTSPAIPPPQRLQPIVKILLIRASSQWSLAAWTPFSDCSNKNSGVISSCSPWTISGSWGPPLPIAITHGSYPFLSISLDTNPETAVFPILFPVPIIFIEGFSIISYCVTGSNLKSGPW